MFYPRGGRRKEEGRPHWSSHPERANFTPFVLNLCPTLHVCNARTASTSCCGSWMHWSRRCAAHTRYRLRAWAAVATAGYVNENKRECIRVSLWNEKPHSACAVTSIVILFEHTLFKYATWNLTFLTLITFSRIFFLSSLRHDLFTLDLRPAIHAFTMWPLPHVYYSQQIDT